MQSNQYQIGKIVLNLNASNAYLKKTALDSLLGILNMLKLNRFWKKYKLYVKVFFLLVGLTLLYKPLFSKQFYGFEYEDSFVSAHVASQDNISQFVEEFRTQGCESLINGECVSVSSYTGHYIPYATYLYLVDKAFNIENSYIIHKVGNAILFVLCFLFIFILYKDSALGIILMFAFISCLPVVYVLNSGLIENLSFCLGLIFIISLHQNRLSNKDWWLVISLLLLLLIVIIKRENLIYLSTLLLFKPKYLIRNFRFWLFVVFLLLSQYLINPFFTEGLESSHLGRSTFSIDYFIFQFPTYLNSFLRFDGFLVLLLFIFLAKKPSKQSVILIIIWFAFILLYSFHYRGQYAIEAGKITHFESFRYMFNTLPLLLGYMIFGKKRSPIFKNILCFSTVIICTFLVFSNFEMLEEFGKEEFAEYHSINKKIDLLPQKKQKIAIHDNFVLISMLNNKNKNTYIFTAKNDFLEYFVGRENILINRFNIIDIDNFKGIYQFTEIKSLSSAGVKAYYFKEF
jgi:hypothetical protein